MKKTIITAACIMLGLASIQQAHAQKEMIGMFYEMKLAPTVCKWTNAADSKKLDATIAAQEKALGITASEKATFMKAAEADIRSDPSNCTAEGMLRPMYDEAVK